MISLSKLFRKDQSDPVIYRTDEKPVTLGDLSGHCYEIFRALDGSLLMVAELEKCRTDEGHNFSQLLMTKLALEHALDRLGDITPNADKNGRTFHYIHEAGKYVLDGR